MTDVFICGAAPFLIGVAGAAGVGMARGSGNSSDKAPGTGTIGMAKGGEVPADKPRATRLRGAVDADNS